MFWRVFSCLFVLYLLIFSLSLSLSFFKLVHFSRWKGCWCCQQVEWNATRFQRQLAACHIDQKLTWKWTRFWPNADIDFRWKQFTKKNFNLILAKFVRWFSKNTYYEKFSTTKFDVDSPKIPSMKNFWLDFNVNFQSTQSAQSNKIDWILTKLERWS